MNLLTVTNLSAGYAGKQVIKDISFFVAPKTIVGILGANGCGKTTLIKAIANLLPHTGSCQLDDTYLENASPRQLALLCGYIPQKSGISIDLTLLDVVLMGFNPKLSLLQSPTEQMKKEAFDALCSVGLGSRKGDNFQQLSEGQKQLCLLARTFVLKRRLLLLDEPTSQLDPIAAGEFFNTLKRINSELGTTVIITEHRLENLFPMVDRVVFMRSGSIVSNCSPADAAEKLRGDDEFFSVLPSSVRIFAKTRQNGQNLRGAPLEVRSVRDYLLNNFSLDSCRHKASENQIRASAKAESSKNRKNTETVISVREAWFRYEKDSKDILCGMNFDVHAGELTCIVGGNGAGKTTALMTAAGVFAPYRGKVKYRGKPISTFRKDKGSAGKIGVLVQNPLCCFVMDSVAEELEATAKAYKLPRSGIEEVIDIMQLQSVLGSNPYDISGGELQRAAIAKLLLPEPEVIFLDEATKGMDAFFKAEFGALLRRLAARGTAIVLVSHDIEFCAEFADRCAMFFNGTVIAEGTPQEVFLGNSFYTTSACRISRGIIPDALTSEQVIDYANRCERKKNDD